MIPPSLQCHAWLEYLIMMENMSNRSKTKIERFNFEYFIMNNRSIDLKHLKYNK